MNDRIPTLDGWRAVAISMVLVHHVAARLEQRTGVPESAFFLRFTMGVDVFFAISGLLITSRLLSEYSTKDRIDLRTFYIRRAFRILPPALLYLATLGVLGLLASKADLLSCLALWRNYYPGSQFTTHFWSLSLEEQFYSVWPWILAIGGIAGAQRFSFCLIVAVSLWRLVALTFLPSYYFFTHTDVHCDGLMWGCVAALAFYRGKYFEVSQAAFWICALGSFALFAVPPAMMLVPLMIAASVLATVQHPGWTVSKLLAAKPVEWIGQRSYGIYVWQQLFLFYDVHLGSFWKSTVLRLAALAVFAEVSFVLFEVPLQNLGRRLAGHAR